MKLVSLLKTLSVINTDLTTNIYRESVEKSYDNHNITKYFNELVNTEMLKKKEGKEGIYEYKDRYSSSDNISIWMEEDSHVGTNTLHQ